MSKLYIYINMYRQEIFSENEKEIRLIYDSNEGVLRLVKGSIIGKLEKGKEEIIFKQVKLPQQKTTK